MSGLPARLSELADRNLGRLLELDCGSALSRILRGGPGGHLFSADEGAGFR